MATIEGTLNVPELEDKIAELNDETLVEILLRSLSFVAEPEANTKNVATVARVAFLDAAQRWIPLDVFVKGWVQYEGESDGQHLELLEGGRDDG